MTAWLEDLVSAAHEALGEREREALYVRGVTDSQIDLYQVGYLDGMPSTEVSREFSEKYRRSHWVKDSFVLPLTTSLGKVEGLQLRHVDKAQKGYSFFSPCEEEPVLFGLAQAMPHVWEKSSVYLVEGGFDLFPIQRVFPNVIATLTSRVTDQVARSLRRLVSGIWLVYDMDTAGRKAVNLVSQQHSDKFKVHDICFPRPWMPDLKNRAKDPGEIWEVWGDEQVKGFLSRQ
jgi:DNA primase